MRQKNKIMTQSKAIKLARYHRFTKKELYEMLVEALDTFTEEYWKLPNSVNHIFDNGYYFNQSRKWVDYQKGINDNEYCREILTVRILQEYGKFSKVQIPIQSKQETKVMVSEKPTL